MAYEHSLHGVIPGLLLLALLWERRAARSWSAVAAADFGAGGAAALPSLSREVRRRGSTGY
jgi:hypothetical protein